jgi:hypothetical protein
MNTHEHTQTLVAHDTAMEAEYAKLSIEERLQREQEFRDSLEGLTLEELRAKKAELRRKLDVLDLDQVSAKAQLATPLGGSNNRIPANVLTPTANHVPQ